MSEEATAKELLAERTVVDIGVEGIALIHFPDKYAANSGLPVDGSWSVTWTSNDTRLHRAPFRTLHAAAHYAFRVSRLPGALDTFKAIERKEEKLTAELAKKLNHAEAHAHETDAVYPAGTLIPMENGPSIVDDDGLTRQWINQAPFLTMVENSAGDKVCEHCGELPVMIWEQ